MTGWPGCTTWRPWPCRSLWPSPTNSLLSTPAACSCSPLDATLYIPLGLPAGFRCAFVVDGSGNIECGGVDPDIVSVNGTSQSQLTYDANSGQRIFDLQWVAPNQYLLTARHLAVAAFEPPPI